MISTEETHNNSSPGNTFSIVLFVLTIVVIANTKPEEFKDVNRLDYYNFILFSLCFSIIIPILQGVFGILLIKNPESTLIRISMGIYIVGSIVLMYYFYGVIWYKYPKHSILFYREFWSDLNIPTNSFEKKWAPVMCDVIFRIFSFLLMFMTAFIAPFIVCFGLCGFCFKKFHDSKEKVSHGIL